MPISVTTTTITVDAGTLSGTIDIGAGVTELATGTPIVAGAPGDPATLDIQAGGTFESDVAAGSQFQLQIGSGSAGASGSLAVSGAGALLTAISTPTNGASPIALADYGTAMASLTISGGGTVVATTTDSGVAAALPAGFETGGTATITVTDANSALIANGNLHVAAGGDASALIENAGSVVVNDAASGGGGVSIGVGYGSASATTGGIGSVAVDSGGLLQVNSASSGILVGSDNTSGTLSVNAGTVWAGRYLVVGESGGTALVSAVNGGSIALTGTSGIGIGQSAASQGTLQVGGSGAAAVVSLGATASGITVGGGGQGTLEVESGGSILMNGTGGIAVGQSASATGLVIVNGSLAAIDIAASGSGIGLGEAGDGTLEIENGGAIILNGTGSLDGISLGQTAGALGLAEVSGGGALLQLNTPNAGVNVGEAGQGQLAVSAGGTVSLVDTTGLTLGSAAGGTGDVFVYGALLASQMVVGGATGSTGGVIVGGTGATLASTGTIQIGNAGTGELDLHPGGVVSAGGGGIAIGSLGALVGFGGVVQAPVLNDGELSAVGVGGTLEITGSLFGTGSVTLSAGMLRLDGAVAGSQSFIFDVGSYSKTLVLGTPGTAFANAIWGLDNGDRIELGGGMTIAGAEMVNGNTIAVSYVTGGDTVGIYDLTDVGLAPGAGSQFAVGTDTATGDSYLQLSTVASTPTYTWTASSGDWSTASAWSPNGVPNASDAVVVAGALAMAEYQSAYSLVVEPSELFTVTGTLLALAYGLDDRGYVDLFGPSGGSTFYGPGGTIAAPGGVTIEAGAGLLSRGNSTIVGNVVNDDFNAVPGSLDVVPGLNSQGSLDITGNLTGAGLTAIQSALKIGGAVAQTQTIQFETGGEGGLLRLDDPAAFSGTITAMDAGFAPGYEDDGYWASFYYNTPYDIVADQIDLANVGTTATVTYSDGTLAVDVPGQSPMSFAVRGTNAVGVTLQDAAPTVTTDGNGGVDISFLLGLTDIWQGGSAGNWSNGANWSLGFAPGTFDRASIGTNPAVITVGTDSQAGSLSLAGPGDTLVVAGGLSLLSSPTLAGGTIALQGGGLAIISAGDNAGLDDGAITAAAGEIGLYNAIDDYGSSLSGPSLSDVGLTFGRNLRFTQVGTDNSVSIGAPSFFDNEGTIIAAVAGGSLSLSASGDPEYSESPQSGVIENDGLIEIGNGETLGAANTGYNDYPSFTNTGTLDIGSGATAYIGDAGWSNTGTIIVGAGSSLTLYGDFAASSMGSYLSGGTLVPGGTVILDGTLVLEGIPTGGPVTATGGLLAIDPSYPDYNIDNPYEPGPQGQTLTNAALSIDSGATLELRGTPVLTAETIDSYPTIETFYVWAGSATSGTITFNGPDATLKLDNPHDFSGALDGLALGDSIDFADTAVSGAAFANGLLTIATASNDVLSYEAPGTLRSGNISLASDGSGGTLLTLNAYTSPPATLTSVTTWPEDAVVTPGRVVEIILHFSAGVAIGGGTPVLTLSNGGIAIYNAAATAALDDPTQAVFTYQVQPTDAATASLTIAGYQAFGATAIDPGGNSVNLASADGSALGLGVSASTAVPAPANVYFIAAGEGNSAGQVYVVNQGGSGATALAPVGASYTNPYNLYTQGDTAFFTATYESSDPSNPLNGQGELWVTDGTSAGTVPLGAAIDGPSAESGLSIVPGLGTGLLGTIGGTAIFETIQEPNLASGTGADQQPTVMLNAVSASGASTLGSWSLGSSTSPIQSFTVAGSTGYFLAPDAAYADTSSYDSGWESVLYQTNGTPGGTSAVQVPFNSDSGYDYGSSGPVVAYDMVAAGSNLFFVAGEELYYAGGLSDGTLYSDNGGTIAQVATIEPDAMVAFGNSLYYTIGVVTDAQLQVSNGGAGNTLDFPYFNDPTALAATGNQVFAVAKDTRTGNDALWVLENGDRSALELTPANGSITGIGSLTAVGNELYFTAFDAAIGTYTLWATNGTAAGTTEIMPAESGYLDPSNLVAANGALYFEAYDPVHGNQLWTSNGTAAGTAVVSDIAQETPIPAYAYSTGFLTVGSAAYFVAYSPATNSEMIWRTGGTAADTTMLAPATGSYSYPYLLGSLGNDLYFTASVPGTVTLWKTDGTAAGTAQVLALPSYTSFNGASGDALYFTNDANQLYAYVPGDTSLTPLSLTLESGISSWQGDAYFLAKDAAGQTGLYKSDGTSAGTSLANLPAIGDTTFFATNNGSIYVNASGTLEQVVGGTLEPIATVPYPTIFVAGNQLFSIGYGMDQLWTSDGTAAGSVAVTPASGSFYYYEGAAYGGLPAAANGNALYFWARDQAGAFSLWRSDGTSAGTIELTSDNGGFVQPGALNSSSLNGEMLFSAFTANGLAIWETDGTAAGTVQIETMAEPSGSYVDDVTVAPVTASPGVITLGAGPQNVTVIGGVAYQGGTGPDTFNITASTIGDTIAGGSGTNTLKVSGGGTLAMGSNITNIQVVSLGFDGPYNFTANNQPGLEIVSRDDDTIHDGNGGDTVVLFGNGGTVYAGSGNDTIYVSAAALANTTIVGGAGQDSLAVTGNSGTAVMGSTLTNITDIHLMGGTQGAAGYTFTANAQPDLVIVGSQGNDTITVGAASQTVDTFGNATTVIADAATASARVAAIHGTAVLEIAGGGNALLNNQDYHGLIVQLQQATDLQMGTSGFITAVGITSGSTIVAQQVRDTLASDAGGDTLIGYAGFDDTFTGTAAGLQSDTIQEFGGNDDIDVTNLAVATAVLTYTQGSGAGTLSVTDGTNTSTFTLAGTFAADAFHVASNGDGGIYISYGSDFVNGPGASSTITGDSSSGTLNVTGGGTLAMAGSITNIQVVSLGFDGPYNFTANNQPGLEIVSREDDTIHDGNGGDTVVLFGNGGTVYAGTGNDTVYVSAAALPNTTIVGGTGRDSLAVTGNSGTAMMGSTLTNIADVHLMGGTRGAAGYAFTANAQPDLVIVGSQGNDTITVGAASQTVDTFGNAGTVIAGAATAGALIQVISGTTTLQISGGGSATLNNSDSHGLIVQLDQATHLQLGAAAFITATGIASGNTIVAQQVAQTLGGQAGGDTLVGYAGYGDTFAGSATGLLNDVIQGLGGNDVIDVTDLIVGSASLSYTQGSGSGTLLLTDGTHSTSITLNGTFAPTRFTLAGDNHQGTLIRYGGAAS